jgi:hypothetical protein
MTCFSRHSHTTTWHVSVAPVTLQQHDMFQSPQSQYNMTCFTTSYMTWTQKLYMTLGGIYIYDIRRQRVKKKQWLLLCKEKPIHSSLTFSLQFKIDQPHGLVVRVSDYWSWGPGFDSRFHHGDHGVGSSVEFRFKAPPGTSYPYITIHLIRTT